MRLPDRKAQFYHLKIGGINYMLKKDIKNAAPTNVWVRRNTVAARLTQDFSANRESSREDLWEYRWKGFCHPIRIPA